MNKKENSNKNWKVSRKKNNKNKNNLFAANILIIKHNNICIENK